MNEQKKQKMLFAVALEAGCKDRQLAGEIASAVVNKMKDGHRALTTKEAIELVKSMAKED